MCELVLKTFWSLFMNISERNFEASCSSWYPEDLIVYSCQEGGKTFVGVWLVLALGFVLLNRQACLLLLSA